MLRILKNPLCFGCCLMKSVLKSYYWILVRVFKNRFYEELLNLSALGVFWLLLNEHLFRTIERISLWLLLNEHLLRIIERLSPARHLSPLMFPPLRGGNSKSDQSYRFTTKTGNWDKNALKMSQNSSEKHQQRTTTEINKNINNPL